MGTRTCNSQPDLSVVYILVIYLYHRSARSLPFKKNKQSSVNKEIGLEALNKEKDQTEKERRRNQLM